MSELLEQRIEAAARAIFDTWAIEEGATGTWEDALSGHSAGREQFPAMFKIVELARRESRAALLASDAVLAQAGMAVVPREATEVMRAAANRLNHPRDEEIYTAMIDAAAPDNGGGERDG